MKQSRSLSKTKKAGANGKARVPGGKNDFFAMASQLDDAKGFHHSLLATVDHTRKSPLLEAQHASSGR